MENEPHFWLFADGACGQGSNAMGSWATFVQSTTKRKLLYGVAMPTTVSRCELIPLIEGLRWIRRQLPPHAGGVRVRVYSDSEYTVKTLCGEYPPGKNEDLWAAMDVVQQGFQIEWLWRERNSHYYMVLCDATCSTLRKRALTAVQGIFGEAFDPLQIETDIPIMPPPTERGDKLLEGLHENSTHSG